MRQIIGMILLVSGTTGMAWSYCQEQRERLMYCKCIKQIYEYLQNEIVYARSSLPEICADLGRRLPEPLARAFRNIVMEINKNNGRSFESIWAEIMAAEIKSLPLNQAEKELLTGFPDRLWFRDGRGQAEGMEHYIEDISRHIKELADGLKSKNKVVMCLGLMGGLMAVILLI